MEKPDRFYSLFLAQALRGSLLLEQLHKQNTCETNTKLCNRANLSHTALSAESAIRLIAQGDPWEPWGWKQSRTMSPVRTTLVMKNFSKLERIEGVVLTGLNVADWLHTQGSQGSPWARVWSRFQRLGHSQILWTNHFFIL